MPPSPPSKRKTLTLGSLPFLFAEMIFAFTYFVFVVRWLPKLFSERASLWVGVVQLLLFHFLFGLCQASFFRTTFTEPGEIPEGWENSNDELEEHQISDANGSSSEGLIPVTQTNKKGEKRKCSKCIKVKPDRTHHCSQCKRCTLKMDHHCPWVNNCVGFYNYKFFVLFLTWTVMLAVFVAACLLDPSFQLSQNKEERDPLVFITFILGAVFGVGLGLFAITHYAYICMNQTTIEVMEKKRARGNIYNLGWHKNFTEVFGDSPLLWFLPVYTTKGDGLTFPTKTNESNYV